MPSVTNNAALSQKASSKKVESSASHVIAADNLSSPICWYEGMLLSPQHFQQNHQYWESQLHQAVKILSPHYWGVGSLELDYSALMDGSIRIVRLFAVLPDGLVVNYDSRQHEPLEVSLSEVSTESVAVQLRLPIQLAGSASEKSEIQRYASHEDDPRADDNTGNNKIPITRLMPKFSLEIANSVGSRYISLPLLKVIKNEGESVQLDPDYCPPLLSISADSFRQGFSDLPGAKPLQQRAKELATAIRYKAKQLAGIVDDEGNVGGSIDQRHHRWIRAMVQELTSFELVSSSSNSTTYDLYQSLIRLVGSVSELSPSGIPPDVQPYDHDDCLPAFDDAMRYILKQINTVNLSYTSQSFDKKYEGVFSLNIHKKWEERDLIIEIKPSSNDNYDGVVKWLKSSRIASAHLHKELAERRMLGTKAESIERDENTGVTAAAGNLLFRIKADKNFVVAGKKLVIVATSSRVKEHVPQSILIHMPNEKAQRVD